MTLKNVGSNQSEVNIGDATIFYSYRTPVAAFVPGRGYLKTRERYSVTTSRHVNRWAGPYATAVDQSEIDALAGI